MFDFELIAVRHGRTEWNRGGRFQGHSDVALDEVGRAQARALGARLQDMTIDRAVASDLVRASETAALVLGDRGVAVEPDPRWREMRFGTWEGLRWDEIVARYPEAATGTRGPFVAPEGGESFADLTERIGLALAALRASVTRARTTVLVATHAGPLHALLRVALGESEAKSLEVRFDPATFTRIAFTGETARLLDLNVGAAP